MINKIIIAGFSGAGKTTLGKRLEQELGLPLVNIDKHCFDPGKKLKPADELGDIVSEICRRDKWIIDGLYKNIAEQFVKKADLLIYIDVGPFTNTKNVVLRKIKNIFASRRKADYEVVRKIHFVNTRRIWRNRGAFSETWNTIIQKNEGSFELLKIKKVNKRTSDKIIAKIRQMNNV